eukprot:1157901-Pelagomonas_calceolata.AAC.2
MAMHRKKSCRLSFHVSLVPTLKGKYYNREIKGHTAPCDHDICVVLDCLKKQLFFRWSSLPSWGASKTMNIAWASCW